MDGTIGAAAQSIDAVNQILQNATAATISMDKKLLAAATNMKVGADLGKGQNIDTTG